MGSAVLAQICYPFLKSQKLYPSRQTIRHVVTITHIQTVIKEHKSLESLILSDVDGQGVLTMNREQLEEFRATPFTVWALPSLKMRIWYAPQLDLPDGTVLKGVTLVAARPAESKKEVCDPSSDAFEEPFRTTAKMLIKRTSGQEIIPY